MERAVIIRAPVGRTVAIRQCRPRLSITPAAPSIQHLRIILETLVIPDIAVAITAAATIEDTTENLGIREIMVKLIIMVTAIRTMVMEITEDIMVRQVIVDMVTLVNLVAAVIPLQLNLVNTTGLRNNVNITRRRNADTERKNASTERRRSASTGRRSASTGRRSASTRRRSASTGRRRNVGIERMSASTERKRCVSTKRMSAITERRPTVITAKKSSVVHLNSPDRTTRHSVVLQVSVDSQANLGFPVNVVGLEVSAVDETSGARAS